LGECFFWQENIIVGQNYIAAESKSKAIEWLNIVRTTLIFVYDNSDELKKDLTENSEEEKVPEVREDYDIPNSFENFWD
jgi:predicted nuclease with TOPRIM domain